MEGGLNLNVQSRNFEHENGIKIQQKTSNCTFLTKYFSFFFIFLNFLKKNNSKTNNLPLIFKSAEYRTNFVSPKLKSYEKNIPYYI
jgi:hypothetical protein